jgi:hypothetical protein
MIITNKDAVIELAKINHSGSGVYISGKCESDLSGVRLMDGSTLSFTFDDVLAKKTELENAEPMRVLRQERNRKLAQTDWRASSDLTLSSEWSTYRQALRDLPSTATPTLDENGNLQNVTWPDEPT